MNARFCHEKKKTFFWLFRRVARVAVYAFLLFLAFLPAACAATRLASPMA
jgi:hypothetical protein